MKIKLIKQVTIKTITTTKRRGCSNGLTAKTRFI
jgi:hypothetical protein